MEDPWASPWETTTTIDESVNLGPSDASPKPGFSIDSRKDDPRQSIASGGFGAVPTTITGWGDDDTFGGWTGAEETAGTGASGWDATEPKLSATNTEFITRTASPDPWRALEEDTEHGSFAAEPFRRGRAVDSGIGFGDDFVEDDFQKSEAPVGSVNFEHAWGPEDTVSPLDSKTIQNHLDNTVRPDSPDISHAVGSRDENNNDAERSELSNNRPTPQPSEEHDEISRPASPDGRPAPALASHNKPTGIRQPSKVRELVDMYDGIAERSVSSSEVSLVPRNSADHHEEAKTDDKPENEPMNEDDGERQTAETESPAVQETKPLEDTKSSVSEKERNSSERSDGPSIPYPIDLSHLDGLFPFTTAASPRPESGLDRSNATFDTTSQRKAWYRLSRMGSIRRHNLGDDDETYVRVGWPKSAVRDETLKVVRRWIEEDATTGRIVLGRRLGGNGANVFGWDSAAPPVEISTLLNRKSARHSRNTSLTSKEPATPNSSATFGWNDTTAPTSPAVSSVSPASVRSKLADRLALAGSEDHPSSPASPMSIRFSDRPQSIGEVLAPKIGPSLETIDIAKADQYIGEKSDAQKIESGEDDDEDWGEMVSSPPPPLDQSSTTNISLPPSEAVQTEPASGFGWDSTAFGDALNIVHPSQLSQESAPANQASDMWGFDLWDKPSSALQASNTPTFTRAQPLLMQKHQQSLSPGPLSTWDGDLTPTSITPTAAASPPHTPKPVTKSPTASIPQQLSQDEEAAVADILRGLPDLSYMLR